MEGIVEGGTSFQLYNPEHTIQQPKATRDEKEEYLNSNRDFVTDLAMKRAYEEIDEETKSKEKNLSEFKERVELYQKELKDKKEQNKVNQEEFRQILKNQIKEKNKRKDNKKKVDMKYDKIIKDCSKEVVSIYPPIIEISDEKKRNAFLQQSVVLKEALEQQIKEKNYNEKDKVIEEKKFMHKENLK